MSLNGFRSRVTSFLLSKKEGKPVILTEWGPVTEEARLQAALNMRQSPEVKARVEGVLVRQFGVARGLLEARRRFPEAYSDD